MPKEPLTSEGARTRLALLSTSAQFSEQSPHLRRCMNKLSGKTRSLIELRYIQGLKPVTIAITKQIGTSANALSRRA